LPELSLARLAAGVVGLDCEAAAATNLFASDSGKMLQVILQLPDLSIDFGGY